MISRCNWRKFCRWCLDIIEFSVLVPNMSLNQTRNLPFSQECGVSEDCTVENLLCVPYENNEEVSQVCLQLIKRILSEERLPEDSEQLFNFDRLHFTEELTQEENCPVPSGVEPHE